MYLSAHEGWIRFLRCLVMFSESQHPRVHAWFVFVGLLHMWEKKEGKKRLLHACMLLLRAVRVKWTAVNDVNVPDRSARLPPPHCRWAQSQSRIMTQGKFHTFPRNVQSWVPWFYIQLWFRMTFYSVWSLLILILILWIYTVSVTCL